MCGGNAFSSALNGVQNLANGLQANATAKGNAKTMRSVAQLSAKQLLEQSQSNASSARAQAAENGLDVDVGVAALLEDEHLSDGAYNASMTLSDANYGAKNIRRHGKLQRNNYMLNAASDFIDMGGQMMGGWK